MVMLNGGTVMEKTYEKRGYINENYHYFHLTDKEGQELDYHFHEFDKMVLLLSGNVIYSLEHEEYEMEPWNILLVPHHTIHKVRIDDTTPYERIIIYFDCMYLRSLVPSMDVMQSFVLAQKKGHYLLEPRDSQKTKIESILRDYEETQKEDEFGVKAYQDTLMIQLLIFLGRIKSVTNNQMIIKMDEKIQEALTYMNEHLSEELSIDILADKVHLSRSYFMHLFKDETGMSVHQSITEKRLLYAARKIREGMPIRIAVSESGFSDYTTFYRNFKSAFKINPSQLKN